MAPRVVSDLDVVARVIDVSQFEGRFLEAEVQQQILLQLQEIQHVAAEKQASMASDISTAQEAVNEAEAAYSQAGVDLESAIAELTKKGEIMKALRLQTESAEAEHEEVQRKGQAEIEAGNRLREAKEAGRVFVEGPLQTLLSGSWSNDKAQEQALGEVEEYLKNTIFEKALAAAVWGALSAVPSERGAFDQITLATLQEVLAAKSQDIEDQLALRAPAEKEAKTELMGLWALLDVCKDKANVAAEEYIANEEAVEKAKAAQKIWKKEVTAKQKACSNLVAEQYLEGEKVREAQEAMEAFGRVRDAAEAAAAAVPENVEVKDVVMEAPDNKVEVTEDFSMEHQVESEVMEHREKEFLQQGNPDILNAPTPMAGA
jgi:hypothetical protein